MLKAPCRQSICHLIHVVVSLYEKKEHCSEVFGRVCGIIETCKNQPFFTVAS